MTEEVKSIPIPSSDTIEELLKQAEAQQAAVEVKNSELAAQFGRQLGPGDRLSIKFDALTSMLLDDKSRVKLDIVAHTMMLALLESAFSEMHSMKIREELLKDVDKVDISKLRP